MYDIFSFRYSPSPPQHPPPQPPARRHPSSGHSPSGGNVSGSVSVPASPVLQPRHMSGAENNPFAMTGFLPRHLTPEPQRRTFSQRFEL